MLIPDTITRDHVLKAISKIDKEGTPARRDSRKYYVLYKKHYYPPKYLISLANYFRTGELLNSHASVFNTYMAQDFLRKIGFDIIVKEKSVGKVK